MIYVLIIGLAATNASPTFTVVSRYRDEQACHAAGETLRKESRVKGSFYACLPSIMTDGIER